MGEDAVVGEVMGEETTTQRRGFWAKTEHSAKAEYVDLVFLEDCNDEVEPIQMLSTSSSAESGPTWQQRPWGEVKILGWATARTSASALTA